MSSYEKLKYLVKKLFKYEDIEKNLPEFDYYGITKDVYKECIKKFNQAKLIISSQKGVNYLKKDLLNNNYFYDNDKNVSLVSSIVHLEDKIKKHEIINYVFKSVPKRIKFMLNNHFSNKFNENLSMLLDNDHRFCYFSQIIKLNLNEIKNICRISIDDEVQDIDIVPLEYFIYENNWYLCCYNLKLNEIDIICSSKIIKSILQLNRDFHQYIDKKDIDSKIIQYVENFHKDEEFLIKVNVATLNQIIELSLTKKISVYEEREKIFNTSEKKKYYADVGRFDIKNLNPKNNILKEDTIIKIPKKVLLIEEDFIEKTKKEIKKVKKRLYKIDLNTKLISMPNYYFSDEEEKFYEDKKYFVKITTSNKKFDLITKIFKIEVVDPDLYRM